MTATGSLTMLIDVKSIEIEQVLLLLLLQVGLIIAAARVMGMLARRIGQPEVIGEIVAGLLLGPSLLGWLAPEMHLALFDPSAMHGVPQGLMPIIVKILSQIGLVLLLFVIGLEFVLVCQLVVAIRIQLICNLSTSCGTAPSDE